MADRIDLAVTLDARGTEAGAGKAGRAFGDMGSRASGATKHVRSADQQLAQFGRTAKNIAASVGLLFGAREVFRWAQGTVSAFSDFDSAMTRSLAIMGDLDAGMRTKLEDRAKETAREVNIAASDMAEGYFFLASAGLDAAQSIEALPSVARFAKAGVFELALATDLLTDAQSALGLASDNTTENLENMNRVSDVLVKANTLANATVQQFSESLTNQAGAALRLVNKEVEEGVAVLAAYADQGVKGAEAGTRLNVFLRDLQKAARNNREEFDRLNITVFDSEGEISNLADILEDLEGALGDMSPEQRGATLALLGFTDKSIAATAALIGTSGAVREYEAGLRDAAGTTQEVVDKQLTAFAEQMGRLRTETELYRIELGDKMAPALGSIADDFDVLKDAGESLAIAVGVTGGAALTLKFFNLAKSLIAARTAGVALGALLGGPAGLALTALGTAAAIFTFRRVVGDGAENELPAFEGSARRAKEELEGLAVASINAAREHENYLRIVGQGAQGIVAEFDPQTGTGIAPPPGGVGGGGGDGGDEETGAGVDDVEARIKASAELVLALEQEVQNQERLAAAARQGAAATAATTASIAFETKAREALAVAYGADESAIEALLADLKELTRETERNAFAADAESRSAARQDEIQATEKLLRIWSRTGVAYTTLERQAGDYTRAIEIEAEVRASLAENARQDEAVVREEITRKHELAAAIDEAAEARRREAESRVRRSDRQQEIQDLRAMLELTGGWAGSTKGLAKAVAELRREQEIRRAVEEELARDPAQDPAKIEAQIRALEELRAELDLLGDAGEDSAFRWENAFIAAFGSIEGGLDAVLTSVLSSLGQLSGPLGTASAIGAGFVGPIIGGLFGGTDRSAEEEKFAQEAERASKALVDFATQLREVTELERLRTDALGLFRDEIKALLGQFEASGDEFSVFFRGLDEGVEDMALAGKSAEEILGAITYNVELSAAQWAALVHATEEFIAAAKEVDAFRRREITSLEVEWAIRLAVAEGREDEAEAMERERERLDAINKARALESDALEDTIEKTYEAEAAARARAEAEAAEAEAAEKAAARRASALDRQEIEALLGGDDRGLLETQLQRRTESRLAAEQRLVDAGQITEEEFDELAVLLERLANKELADFDAALAAVAETAAAAKGELEDEIRLRELALAGKSEELELARLEIQHREELAEAIAIVGDETDSLIERLVRLQEGEEKALRERLLGDNVVTPSLGEGSSSLAASSLSGVTEATGLRMTDILLSQLVRLTNIEYNTARLASTSFSPGGVAGRPPSSASADGGGSTVVNIIQYLGEGTSPEAVGVATESAIDRTLGITTKRTRRIKGNLRVDR